VPTVLNNLESLAYFAPELVLVGAMLLATLWDLIIKPRRRRVLGVIAISVVALAFSAGASLLFLTTNQEPQSLFYGLIVLDPFANIFRLLFAIVTTLVILIAAPGALTSKPGGARHNASEMIVLLVVIALGMNLVAASRNLLMIYLSLEMVSVLSFVLAGYKLGDRKSSEGALKYVIFGGVASGIMLYGMSWIYGATGSLYLGDIWTEVSRLAAANSGQVSTEIIVGVVCMLAGFGYKIAAAPFHMWTPDVYEGAPTPITAFLSVGPKAAGFAILIRFFADALGARGLAEHGYVEAVVRDQSVHVMGPWFIVAGCLAMATMTIGNLSALHQNNVKRMLAYSSIAHAGYMLMGFTVFSEAGAAAIAFYVFVYCFMNLGAFLIVLAVAEHNGGDETLGAFKGLGRRAPVTAVLMALFLFSLAGIPPLAGFIGKFYIFYALIKAGSAASEAVYTFGSLWCWIIAIVGILNSVISLFYYARVIRTMYLDKADSTDPVDIRKVFATVAVVLAIPTIFLGVYWSPLYDFITKSIRMVGVG